MSATLEIVPVTQAEANVVITDFNRIYQIQDLHEDSLTQASDVPRALDGHEAHIDSPVVRFRVSSRHLCLASEIFRSMIEGPFKEGIRNDEGRYTISAHDWDAKAFLVVLDIIHGHHRSIPKTVDLEMLGHIAMIVDYYKCHEIMELFVGPWVASARADLPFQFGNDCASWLFISYVFSMDDILETMKEMAFQECKGPIETSLPIPDSLISKSLAAARRE
ncbi:hypothetical protein B0I35DRAFT_358936 [Stachybotrys elegans]|uniref:BTB domain-containing protein n=1 Tax=Stachybotrys elegans TaxID=80388 RepID=A0A8K0SJC7_9HYPO|nr:hypothetical protein B0I35DRAFT_358936 [Stachybotrys elegans]